MKKKNYLTEISLIFNMFIFEDAMGRLLLHYISFYHVKISHQLNKTQYINKDEKIKI